MRNLKVIIIAIEVAMIIGVALIAFSDWAKESQFQEVWMLKTLQVLFAIAAVVCQREQQNIDWDEDLEEEF